MKIRMHRFYLDESMSTAREIEPTKEALFRYLQEFLFYPFDENAISVCDYDMRPDARIGWIQTCCVLLDGKLIAFTDSQFPK